MDPRTRWERTAWALPWLLFLAFPVADLVTTERPAPVRVAAAAALVLFTVLHLHVVAEFYARDRPRRGRALAAMAVLGAGLAIWLGPGWAGLMVYVAGAAVVVLPDRWIWPWVLGCSALSAGVLVAAGSAGAGAWIVPVMCALTAFALRGTRFLVSVNIELQEAREELARAAVTEERLRFARDLHDLLGHSLSLIALKSELAGRLAERDPARARQEMADVEAAARRSLAEVREAVGGYRTVTVAQALAEARPALAAAGIDLHRPASLPALPGPVDTALGWAVREAVTNALRHSRASTVEVGLGLDGGQVTLTVEDDGRGPDRGPGAGLSGLAERVGALGGHVDGGRSPSGGFRLTARLPVGAPQPAVAP